MYFPEDTTLASHYVKKALPLMIKNSIPPNPCNYALWYSYVANKDNDLKSTIDKELEEQGSCSESFNTQLFKKHIIKDEIELQENIQASFSNIVQDLSCDVAKTKDNAEDFQHCLEESIKDMEEHPEDIGKTIESLIESTKSVSHAANEFQEQLASAENEIADLRRQLEEKEKDILTDQLTKIGNRRAFDQSFFEAFKEKQTTTLILVDLDHFKKLNDTYGHIMGDRVLQAVGEVLKQACPENALPCRYGGEEFGIIFSGDISEASHLAELIRETLQKVSLKKKNSDEIINSITASFGVAQLQDGEYPEQVIVRADEALYAAKEAGRNQVKQAA